MAPIDTVLQRLDKPRQRGREQWSCRCPAHEDRGPSLSVKELDDGRVLLHCFAGCSVEQVIGAMGLQLEDLFPPRPSAAGAGAAPPERRRLITAGQALELLDQEAGVIAVAAANVAYGVALKPDDFDRVLVAAARISMLREECRA